MGLPHGFMSLDALERPSAPAALSYQFHSTRYTQMSHVLPMVLKGGGELGDMQSAASVQYEQPLSTGSLFQPAAGVQNQHGTMIESELPSTGGQAGIQPCLALFMQAYLSEAQVMKSAEDAALHLAPTDSPGSSEQQPAEPSEAAIQLPADVGSLQHPLFDCPDGQESMGGATWLAAFMDAHLQGPSSSMQHADHAQLLASSHDQLVNDCDDGSDANSDDEESDADSDDEESDADSDNTDSDLDPRPLTVQSQLCCTLKGKVQRLASTAVGLGYHAAGAAYGSVLGLRQGLRKSSI